jgi:hypothetical protein
LEPPISVTLAAGRETKLRLAIRRADLVPYQRIPGVSDYQYQSLLEVSDGAGSVVHIPITARGNAAEVPRVGLAASGPAQPDPRAGLWVGTAAIRGVSQPANLADPNTPRATKSEAQFRLILHVDTTGQTRLLQHATLMWADGVADAQGNTVQPGRQVLIAADTLLSRYTDVALRDGQPVGRRVSSVAFGNATPIAMAGRFGDPQNPLSCSVAIGYDDPLNPFKHRFHPDHDNLDEEYATKLAPGAESFTVSRALSLEFTAADPDGLSTSRWGADQLGGIYSEVVAGLHKTPIVIRGTFRLNRVSLIAALDGQN